MLAIFNDVYASWDVREPYDVIYLDFQKVFDEHKWLLTKLRAHGIGEDLCAWIGDWLSDRQQCVVLNSEVSDWQKVISGVPQGSVLGSTLFIIYVNDLESNILSQIAKFEDDIKLGGRLICTEDCDKIQDDLN